MLSKQEIVELLRYPIYKVELRLLHDPYTGNKDMGTVDVEKVCEWQPSIHRTLFWYIHTQESIKRGEESIKRDLFYRGSVVYYLQIKNDEVYEVSNEVVNRLGSIVNIGKTPILLGFAQDGLYKTV